jgi:UDP-3-O-[3-hydroxymyristoyl] N-acetylglucosamine deacetylase
VPAGLNSKAVLTGKGITSGQNIMTEVSLAEKGHGIVFSLEGLLIPARVDYVVNTLRNVVLGQGTTRLCIVEHFLAAACLWGLNDILVKVDGPEMPFGDGSARLWIELFKNAGWPRNEVKATLDLAEPIINKKGDKILMALPDEQFSLSYHMDWNHPLIGKRWQSWQAQQDIAEIADARTFGWLQEHQMLGIGDEVVSLTATEFTKPLRFPDEPVRHKLLDLLGDLVLAGVNPMQFKAKFISIKAGHELDVEMARSLVNRKI